MTKQEKSQINREMKSRAMAAWKLAYDVSERISLPYEIEALDVMIAELQGMRQFKIEQLERMNRTQK